MRKNFVTLVLAGTIAGCETTETEVVPVDPPVFRVLLAPGSSEYLTLEGGMPPYRLLTSPSSDVATAIFVDSTTNPAYLEVLAEGTAFIGDTTSFRIGDESLGAVFAEVTVFLTTGPSAFSYAGELQPVWEVRCRSRGCHPGGGAPFSLEYPVSWQNLVGTPASNSTCGVPYRVVPFNPDSSLVYLLVTGQTACPRMPLSSVPGDTLPKRDRDKVLIWIQAGAANN
jgi:hypothetical protein